MLYRIYYTGPHPDKATSRRRADAAKLAAERMAYEIIAGFGGLDTQQGHAAYARVQAIDPKRGGQAELYGGVLFVTPSHS